MPKEYTCPFWKWDNGLVLHCEGAKIFPPDFRAKREYIGQYCTAKGDGWKQCSIAAALLEYYDRKDEDT